MLTGALTRHKYRLDGFALNIADPGAPFVADAMSSMFGYAAYVGNFKLYISMDLYAYGDGCFKANRKCYGVSTIQSSFLLPNTLTDSCQMFDYHGLLSQYLTHPAWYTDTPNGHPMVSTFSSGGFVWQNFSGRVHRLIRILPLRHEPDTDVASQTGDTNFLFPYTSFLISMTPMATTVALMHGGKPLTGL